jgi:hypothetical protein
VESDLNQKLHAEINQFLEVYNALASGGKDLFEIQLAESLHKADDKTRELYRVLLSSAKAGKGPAEIIRQLQGVTSNKE